MPIEKSHLCPTLPISLRLINQVAVLLKKAGLLSVRGLSPEKLLKFAQEKTKLTNFGDERFVEHLRVIMRTFEEDNHLSYLGERTLLSLIKSALNRRLFLERDFQVHSEILQIPIKQPIVVVGFPRTGTTLLQTLLLHHPGCRWLRQWEIEEPFPTVPGTWGSSKDPRRWRFEAGIKKLPQNGFYQALNNIHPLDSPEECWQLFVPTFVFNEILIIAGFDRYKQWLDNISEHTWREVYHYYKQYLQYLSWHQPGCHWVVKYPGHIKNLGTLLELFPDARIIQLHRDPNKFVPSSCSNTFIHQCMFFKNPNPKKIGSEILTVLSEWERKNLALRKALDPKSFYDVHYQELVETPMEVVKNIYDYFQMEWPVEMESNLNQWLINRHEKNRPHHQYSLAQFGLTPAKITREFEEYCEYFRVRYE